MLSTHRFAWMTALLLAGVVAVVTLSSRSNSEVTTAFSGTIAPEGVRAHTFTIPRDGVVEVTLTALGPAAGSRIGLGLGTPTAAGTCALVEARDEVGVTAQIGGTLHKGLYCVAVYDSGNMPSAQPLVYTISVTEP